MFLRQILKRLATAARTKNTPVMLSMHSKQIVVEHNDSRKFLSIFTKIIYRYPYVFILILTQSHKNNLKNFSNSLFFILLFAVASFSEDQSLARTLVAIKRYLSVFGYYNPPISTCFHGSKRNCFDVSFANEFAAAVRAEGKKYA